VAAALGALLGFFGSYGIWWLERQRQRRIARMQIVINLRRWMMRTMSLILDTQTWVDSDGHGGSTYSKLPNFRFEKSLEQVALMEHRTAMQVFKLIHKKDNANDEFGAAIEYEDSDVALDIIRGRSAQVWLRALGIYDRVSARIGWSDRAFSNENKAMMQNEIDRFQKLEQARAKSNRELMAQIQAKFPER